MSTAISPARLETVRLVREHCYQALMPMPWVNGDEVVIGLAEAALETPIETMAGWIQMSDTVIANLRLVMTMIEQSMVD